jgi:dihydrofolate reductase
VSGPTLAAQALRARLVDTCHLYVVPTVVGGGLPAFPPPARLTLDLVEERRFACGVVYLQYNLRV